MNYESVILSDIKRKNRKSFWHMVIFTTILCAGMMAILIWQNPQDLVLIGLTILGTMIFTIIIWGGICLSPLTYTALENESNHFEANKLRFIDADYTTAMIFKGNCRVGRLYVYGYCKNTFLLVPIRQIDSFKVEYWLSKPSGYMIIMYKQKVRCAMGPFDNEEYALQIIRRIAQQKENIIY